MKINVLATPEPRLQINCSFFLFSCPLSTLLNPHPHLQHNNTHLGLVSAAKQTLQMKISTRKTGLGPSSIQISKYPTQWSDSSPGLVTQAWLGAEKININISVHTGCWGERGVGTGGWGLGELLEVARSGLGWNTNSRESLTPIEKRSQNYSPSASHVSWK